MSILAKFFRMSAHMKIAMIVAPLLLIGGWGVADYFESRKSPSDQVFPMETVGPCILSEGACRFSILEFNADVSAAAKGDGTSAFVLKTSEPVKAVNLEVVGTNSVQHPKAMVPDAEDSNLWTLDTVVPFAEGKEFHMVISTGEAFLFADGNW